jgi:error-prone DNA polymerase
LSDFDGVYGLVQGHLAARRLAEGVAARARGESTDDPDDALEGGAPPAAVRLFHGAQVAFDLPGFESFLQPDGRTYTGGLEAPVFLQNRLALVARSRAGYASINRLLAYVHREGKQALPLRPDDDEAPWPAPEGVWAILPCRGASQLFCNNQTRLFSLWLGHVEHLRRRWGDALHLAATPPSIAPEHNALANHLRAQEVLGIPLLATDDVFFHAAARKELHDLVTAVSRNEPLDTCRWAQFANAERTFHAPAYLEAFCRRSAPLRAAFDANARLAEGVSFCLSELTYRYPREFIPPEHTSQSFLEHLVREACRARYGEVVPTAVAELLVKELDLVEELGYADYFLTVWDIVRFARSQGILCQGRGSAANSAVCFLLGVTALDPEAFDLVFERFISRERGEPPDIDVDFEHERREEVIQYIYARYGRKRAAMVANVITFRKRGALRAVGKALGFSDKDLSTVHSVLVDRFAGMRPLAEILSEGIARLPLDVRADAARVGERWARLAGELIGFPRHLGLHSGGFVLSHEPLSDIVPVEPATMEGRSVIQWNKDDIEALGLFKVDVLALGMLTALRKTFAALDAHRLRVPGTATPVGLATLPQNCPKTFAMIRAADTTGVFQIESRAQMSMLPRLKPRVFYDLVIEVAIVRPGPIVGKMVHPYLKRRMGQEKVEYPDPRLVPILKKTLGVPIFQEQVMRIAVAVGNFTPGEADELRRSMGAWKFKGTVARFEEKLLGGMKSNGIPDAFAKAILEQIQGFSEYGFPESHAVSFALLAYASSWLKAHYPVYFLCGLLNSQPLGFYSVHSLLQESSHKGQTHLPPCIAHSGWDSHVVADPRGRPGAPSTTLRLGLRLVSGVCEERARVFVEKRAFLPDCAGFDAYVDLFLSCFSSQEQIPLVMGGVFHSFDSDRRAVLWHVLAQPSPLRPDAPVRRFAPKESLLEAWDVLRDDTRSLGTSLGPHAMHLIKRIAWPFAVPVESLVTARELAKLPDRATVTVAGLALVRQMPPTAKGMMFITLEDETGTMNLVLQPQVSQAHRAELVAGDLQCVTARAQANGTARTLLVTKVHPLAALKRGKESLPPPPPTPREPANVPVDPDARRR